MEERIPSDVIKAIFHFIGERERFPANIPKIHKAFYELSQDSELSNLFKDFIFDTSRIYPHSELVESALDRLQKVNLLACINPGLDEFEISKRLALQKDIESLFSSEEQEKLKKGAKKFLCSLA